MGFPVLPSADMPGGGPAYPLSALGARAHFKVNDWVNLLAGVYNGSPLDANGFNRSGTSFPLNGGALVIAEAQVATPTPDASAKPDKDARLPFSAKVGFWYDSDKFADQRIDDKGLSLADPNSGAIAASHRGDYGFYAVLDQMVYRLADEDGRSSSLFARPMFTPLGDRNLISFSVNAGLTMHAPFAERDGDTFGLGGGFAQVSSSASGFDRDVGFYNPGSYAPVRSNETFLEATYQYQATPWLQIQPDVQYVFNPGAGALDPNQPTRKVRDEAVFGVRTNILF